MTPPVILSRVSGSKWPSPYLDWCPCLRHDTLGNVKRESGTKGEESGTTLVVSGRTFCALVGLLTEIEILKDYRNDSAGVWCGINLTRVGRRGGRGSELRTIRQYQTVEGVDNRGTEKREYP